MDVPILAVLGVRIQEVLRGEGLQLDDPDPLDQKAIGGASGPQQIEAIIPQRLWEKLQRVINTISLG